MVRAARAVHLFFHDEEPQLRRLGYRGPVVVATNGIDPPPSRWDGGSGGYVAWLGRFDPHHKGVDLLVEAVGRIPAPERPALRLHGPDWRGGKGRIARAVHEQGLSRWIEVCDAVYGQDKWEVLSRAGAFVYPSRWEGFGNSVAEAAAIGVPIVATPYPLGRVLAARGAAILAEATSESIAAALRQLRRSDTAALGRCARDVVLGEMGWDKVARSWLAQVEATL
jgi:glycosyltransferase involved in cell wall biosynthesis